MPKINVYLSDELAEAVKDAQIPVSSVCQNALEQAVRDVAAARAATVEIDAPDAEEMKRSRMFTQFTDRARQVVSQAQALAGESGVSVEDAHLLLAMLAEGANLGVKVLTTFEIDPADLRVELVAVAGTGPRKTKSGKVRWTDSGKRALEETHKEALALGHNYIGCEHILLGVLAAEDGPGSRALRRMGIELRTTRRAVQAALAGVVHKASSPPAPPAGMEEVLRRLEALEARLAD